MSATTAADFAQLEQYRGELVGYCYRMLGSPFEAEDAVQDTLLRAWKAQDRFEGRAQVRTWLYRIATNVCLDAIDGRKRRATPMDLGPAREPIAENLHVPEEVTWLEPMPADPADAAVASVNSALQRARATLDTEASTESRPLDAADRELLARYVAAFEAYDID